MCFRYLESCTGPALKRKSDSHSLATSSSSSSTSEDDKPAETTDTAQASSDGTNTSQTPHSLPLYHHLGIYAVKFFVTATLYSLSFPWFDSGTGQWGVSGPDGGSSCWSASDRHHDVHQGYERSLCHQPVFIQQHHCPCATAWIRYETYTGFMHSLESLENPLNVYFVMYMLEYTPWKSGVQNHSCKPKILLNYNNVVVHGLPALK